MTTACAVIQPLNTTCRGVTVTVALVFHLETMELVSEEYPGVGVSFGIVLTK